ncbi:MAG: chemotaxis protein CheC [Chromatiales bacterium]|nr:chemotaxis protein CheC [Chromatiales bacterium]
MTQLSELQMDALTELFNVGVSRAAASFSEIVNDRVELTVPKIEICRLAEIGEKKLSSDEKRRVGAVSQRFSGAFDANALLFFAEEHTLKILGDMLGSQVSADELAEFEQEAMCELGNIILNSCLSAMTDMLGITLNSSLPQYYIGTYPDLSKALVGRTDDSYIILMDVTLAIRKQGVEGQIVFVLSTPSLASLVSSLDRLIENI